MRSVSPVPRPLLVAGAALVIVAGACGADGGSPSVAVPSTDATPARASATSSGPASPSPASEVDSLEPATDRPRPDLAEVRISLTPVADGLDDALFVTAANDSSGRLFVAQQGGIIRVVRDGTALREPFVDLSDRIAAGGERGLLGLAFPPGFGPQRPEVYVHYTDLDGDTTVAALTVAGDADRADPSSERIILTADQPYANHNGGWIGFDPDGMLLVALGDGGSGGDPQNRASDPGEPLGKMLRIDVLGAPEGVPYSVPADNPFVGQAGARPEILHYGLRNPFRSSIDVETGDLWIGDVGQNEWEEVDVARAGAVGLDFGWRRWEGSHCFDEEAGCHADGVTMPVSEYSHAEGCSVIGGVVYRGDAIPALRGGYLFADYCSGRLWAIDAGLDGPQEPTLLSETGRQLSSIGMDETGEVWLTDLGDGALLRLDPA